MKDQFFLLKISLKVSLKIIELKEKENEEQDNIFNEHKNHHKHKQNHYNPNDHLVFPPGFDHFDHHQQHHHHEDEEDESPYALYNISRNNMHIKESNDSLSFLLMDCEPLNDIINKNIEEMEEYLKKHPEYEKVLDKYERITKSEIEKTYKTHKILLINDFLNTLNCHGIKFPCSETECITNEDYELIQPLSLRWFFAMNVFNNADIIEGRALLEDVLYDMEYTYHCNHEECSFIRYHHYCGHDFSLIPILSVVQFDLDFWPPYASHIVIELFEDNNNVEYIRMSLNSQIIKIGKKYELYPFEEFKQFLNEQFKSKPHC